MASPFSPILSYTHIHPLYLLFFHYIEPLSTILGAYYAYFQPHLYLSLSHSPSAGVPAPHATVPLATRLALAQLANLYLLFALNEGLVLRVTRSKAVWRTLLIGLLVADLGHLWTGRLLVSGGDNVGGREGKKLVQGAVGEALSWAEWMMRPAEGGSAGWTWGHVYWRVWEWNSMGWGNVGFGELCVFACLCVCYP
jgi:hypothetical protein